MKRTAGEYAILSGLLDEALELPAQARSEWVEQLPESCADLKPTLRRLLLESTAGDSVDLMEMAGHVEAAVRGAVAVNDLLAFKPGSRIDSYELMRELGRGGMGTVWLARRVEGLTRRLVALKLPHPGLFHAELAERIARERDILEGLAHPHIARLYDAGITAAGQPYLALEYIEGVPINEHCDAKRLTIPERIRLFQQVLQAVQFAHSHLVIHRDLKPANILVTDAGKVVLLDFGIAKLLTDGATAETALTRLSGRALTLDYASPEQIAGQPLTTASDVYSLGVVLYEVLCGERPYRLKHQSVAALEQAILNADIRRPSQVVAGLQANEARSTTPRKLSRLLQGDLDVILLKAIRTLPADRYPTVDAFGLDLARQLAGEPVHARRESRWYLTRKFITRYRTAVAAVCVVIVALSVGIGVALWQARVARGEAHRAEAVQNFLISIFAANSRNQADPLKSRSKTARELLADGQSQLASDASLPLAARLKLLDVITTLYNEMELYDEAAALALRRVAILRTAGKDAQIELAQALIQYAGNLVDGAEPAGAMPALREAERILDAHGELESGTAGHAYSYLAKALVYSDGAASLRYAERATQILAREDPVSLANLGALWMLAQAKRPFDPPAAEVASQRAMDVALRLYGNTSPIYGDSALFLADVQADQLKLDAADRNFLIAEAVSLRTTASDDHLVLQTGLRYGKFLLDAGRVADGQARIEKTLAAAILKHGKEDRVYTAWALEYSAVAWLRRGALDPALEQAQRSLDIYLQQGLTDVTAKLAELSCDLLLLKGDAGGAAMALQLSRDARAKTGTAGEPGFKQGLILRTAELALAAGEIAKAQTLYEQVTAATMPEVLRYRRYRFDAGIGIARAHVVAGDAAAGVQAADAVIDALGAVKTPTIFSDRMAAALAVRASAYAGSQDCGKARADWDKAETLLRAFEDPTGYRLRALSLARRSCSG